MLAGPQPMSLATDVYKYLVFNNPNWDFKTINPETDFPLAEKAIATSMDATNPNLKPFVDRGGKLIMYHGWSDPGIPPMNTVQYYKKVSETFGGASKTMNSIRLFMIPGMNHCAGGDGTDKFDGIARTRAVGRERKPRRNDPGITSDGRKSRSHAATVPVSANCNVQGNGEHGRSGELCL